MIFFKSNISEIMVIVILSGVILFSIVFSNFRVGIVVIDGGCLEF